jgi:hypothetical protein
LKDRYPATVIALRRGLLQLGPRCFAEPGQDLRDDEQSDFDGAVSKTLYSKISIVIG